MAPSSIAPQPPPLKGRGRGGREAPLSPPASEGSFLLRYGCRIGLPSKCTRGPYPFVNLPCSHICKPCPKSWRLWWSCAFGECRERACGTMIMRLSCHEELRYISGRKRDYSYHFVQLTPKIQHTNRKTGYISSFAAIYIKKKTSGKLFFGLFTISIWLPCPLSKQSVRFYSFVICIPSFSFFKKYICTVP